MRRGPECFLDQLQGLLPRADLTIKLSLLNRLQDRMEGRPRLIAEGYKVIAGQEAGGADLLRRGVRDEAADEVVVIEVPMAGTAIEPVQFKMLVEAIEANEALQRRSLHLWHVLETQMIRNERGNLRRVVVREPEATADFFGHARTDFDVLVKSNASVGT